MLERLYLLPFRSYKTKGVFWLIQKCIIVPITRKPYPLWQNVKEKKRKRIKFKRRLLSLKRLYLLPLRRYKHKSVFLFVPTRTALHTTVWKMHNCADNSQTVHFMAKCQGKEKKENEIVILLQSSYLLPFRKYKHKGLFHMW